VTPAEVSRIQAIASDCRQYFEKITHYSGRETFGYKGAWSDLPELVKSLVEGLDLDDWQWTHVVSVLDEIVGYPSNIDLEFPPEQIRSYCEDSPIISTHDLITSWFALGDRPWKVETEIQRQVDNDLGIDLDSAMRRAYAIEKQTVYQHVLSILKAEAGIDD
jgi:hypothetical protein